MSQSSLRYYSEAKIGSWRLSAKNYEVVHADYLAAPVGELDFYAAVRAVICRRNRIGLDASSVSAGHADIVARLIILATDKASEPLIAEKRPIEILVEVVDDDRPCDEFDSGYGMLLLRGAELNAVHIRIPLKLFNRDGCTVHGCVSAVYGYEALISFVLENKHLENADILLKRCC